MKGFHRGCLRFVLCLAAFAASACVQPVAPRSRPASPEAGAKATKASAAIEPAATGSAPEADAGMQLDTDPDTGSAAAPKAGSSAPEAGSSAPKSDPPESKPARDADAAIDPDGPAASAGAAGAAGSPDAPSAGGADAPPNADDVGVVGVWSGTIQDLLARSSTLCVHVTQTSMPGPAGHGANHGDTNCSGKVIFEKTEGLAAWFTLDIDNVSRDCPQTRMRLELRRDGTVEYQAFLAARETPVALETGVLMKVDDCE